MCQVSGIIYHISLIAGLEIIERHNHSVDIYTDETRFTPLGTDASIVYGYKDLRVKNNLPFSIKFEMEIKDNFIQVNLRSEKMVEQKQLFFESKMDHKNVIVNVLNSDRKLLNQSIYIKIM
ncbi:VanW like protein [compost metagenome]